MAKNLLESLKSMPTLMGQDGDGFTPSSTPGQAGHQIRQWGYQQALGARDRKRSNFWANRGNKLFGFLPPSNATPLPNQWEVMGEVNAGRQRAIEGAGGNFNMDIGDAYNDGSKPNTRWDAEQIGVASGNSLGMDVNEFQNALNATARPSRGIIANLRRKFGL